MYIAKCIYIYMYTYWNIYMSLCIYIYAHAHWNYIQYICIRICIITVTLHNNTTVLYKKIISSNCSIALFQSCLLLPNPLLSSLFNDLGGDVLSGAQHNAPPTDLLSIVNPLVWSLLQQNPIGNNCFDVCTRNTL